jgi:DNA-directed RNA polymerase I and III subunit RPAC1
VRLFSFSSADTDLHHTRTVLSQHMIWEPKGEQAQDWKDDPPRPVHNDILLAKLRPGQKMKLELHCTKGIGKDHAKFSPVCTASYRLLPHIDISDPLSIGPQDIPKFVQCFPKGVIGVRKHKESGREEVYVKNARKDTVSREVLRHPEFQDKVKLGRIRDHFLYDIESTGAREPQILLPCAIKVLLDKIRVLRKGVEQLEQQHSYTVGPGR